MPTSSYWPSAHTAVVAQLTEFSNLLSHSLPLPLPLPLCSLPLPLCSLSLSRPLPLHITCLQAVAAVCLAVADASEVSLTTWEVSGVRSGTAQIPPLPASTLAVCLASPDTAQSKS